jgi:hypothetical protein
LVVSFPIIGFVIEITKDILHFLREFRKESKQRGGALATLSFFKSVFLQKIKSFEFFKTFHN